MRITKHAHAHLTVEMHGRRLIIDPGMFSSDAVEADVDAVVVTHEHSDHWTAAHLQTILNRNPTATVYGPQSFADAAIDVNVSVVKDGDRAAAGPFELRFSGSAHAPIHASFPPMSNVGVTVNGTLYHPGDSYELPQENVEIVAVPIGGPWHKLAESIDWLTQMKPAQLINVHDETLSAAGQDMAKDVLGRIASRWGGRYISLARGESIEVPTRNRAPSFD